MPRNTTRRRLSEQQREQRRQADREHIKAAVQQLRSSDGWQQWLATRARFRQYSLTNQLLINLAMPEATRVAGFKAWLGLGYCVKRGEQAVIRIWMPIPPSRSKLEAWKAAGADPEHKPRTFFRLAPVWDRNQVEPLPPPANPAPLDPPIRDLDGDELADTLPRLDALAKQLGLAVATALLPGGAHGCYEPAACRIGLAQGLSINQRVKTYCHELAHALARLDRRPEDPELDYAEEELVAESVAATTISSLGLDPDGYSIPYLTSWAEHAEIEVIERTAALIDRLAARIELAIHDTEQPPRSEQAEATGAEESKAAALA
jgi:antirestriction protein ArdC